MWLELSSLRGGPHLAPTADHRIILRIFEAKLHQIVITNLSVETQGMDMSRGAPPQPYVKAMSWAFVRETG